MTLSQFSAGLDRWGAGLARWPECDRRAATSLLERSAEAQAMMIAAVRLDAFIRVHDPAQAVGDDALPRVMNSVMASLPKVAPARRSWLGRSWLAGLGEWLGSMDGGREWLPRFAMSMATAAVLGLVVGDHLVVNGGQQVSPIEALAMSNTYMPLELR